MILAIAKKEMRENLVWAAIGLAVVSLAFYAGLSTAQGGLLSLLAFGTYRFYGQNALPLLSERLLSYTTVVYAILGAALGLLQTIPESRRGTYQFLVHRPISRGGVLLGKIAGGSTLYVAAGLPPLLVGVIWVAVPGHYAAPFRIAMAGALVADFLAGLVFYFAGLLVGIRSARWYGTRLAGFVFALVVAVAVHAVPYFWVAVLVEVGGAAVLVWATYSAFVRREF